METYATKRILMQKMHCYKISCCHLGSDDIYAQKVDTNGNIVWTNPILIDGGANLQQIPAITRTTDNNFIIVYSDYEKNSYVGKLKAQKINQDGQILLTNGGKIISTNHYYYNYDITTDNAGGAFVLWQNTNCISNTVYGAKIFPHSSGAAIVWLGLKNRYLGESIFYQ